MYTITEKWPERLSGTRVLVTGVGFRKVDPKKLFLLKRNGVGQESHTSLFTNPNTDNKANIGAATALACARMGASVLMVGRSEEKLGAVKKWIEEKVDPNLLSHPSRFFHSVDVDYVATDLSDFRNMERLARGIPEDKKLYWVQSIGLGAGTVDLKDDNPYVRIDDITPELVKAEMSVLATTIELMQLLLPRFRRQKETRICIVSSMSAVRSVISGSLHNAAKGALSRFANAAMLELHRENIFITDVRPGGVDTGLYDSDAVQKAVVEMARGYGVDWSKEKGGIRLMPALDVGEMIAMALSSQAHITSINMVARDQWPHESS